jgi:hypothetical protein
MSDGEVSQLMEEENDADETITAVQNFKNLRSNFI